MNDILKPYDLKNKRVLEFGAGMGILGSYLHSQGIDVYMLEPGGIGFERNSVLIQSVTKVLGVNPGRVITSSVENLILPESEKFDCIFSNNALEHVDQLESCLVRLLGLLKPGGRMIHNCPNYLIPFEPHYGIPLIPIFPRLTGWFASKKITSDGCWKSLNFIDSMQLKRIAKRHRCRVSFKNNLMHQSFLRLEEDDSFQQRHPGLLLFYRTLKPLFNTGVLKLIPGSLSTPMVFELKIDD